jgi:hypothetical protein
VINIGAYFFTVKYEECQLEFNLFEFYPEIERGGECQSYITVSIGMISIAFGVRFP